MGLFPIFTWLPTFFEVILFFLLSLLSLSFSVSAKRFSLTSLTFFALNSVDSLNLLCSYFFCSKLWRLCISLKLKLFLFLNSHFLFYFTFCSTFLPVTLFDLFFSLFSCFRCSL